jgi:hypothetical protein
MPAFVPILVCTPYHFDIKRNRQGYWIARDRGGLAGGTFLTRKDAEHFALFETGGDNAHVHTYPEGNGRRFRRAARQDAGPTCEADEFIRARDAGAVEHRVYGGPRVRIHLPPGGSPLRT